MIIQRPISRKQLAAFLPDQESVLAVEKLFKLSGEQNPTNIAELFVLNEETNTLAESANARAALAEALAHALEPLAEEASTRPPVVQPNNVPVDSIQFNTTNHPHPPYRIGETNWDAATQTLATRVTDGVILQHGQEMHNRYINATGSTIHPGQLIAYLAPSPDPETPLCQLFLADGTMSPTFIGGLSTNTAAPGEVVFATWFGIVRDLDTTPYTGNELFASPTVPGGLTGIKPAAPDIAVAICGRLSIHPTEGRVRVRINPPPVNSYADIASTVTQAFAAADTPQAITFNSAPFAYGFSIGAPASRIVAGNAGLYAIRVALQITSSSSSTQGVFIWARKNGVDIPLSSSHITIASNSSYILPNVAFVIPLLAGEYFEIMAAVTSTNVSLTANAAQVAPYPRPASPSAKLRIAQASS